MSRKAVTSRQVLRIRKLRRDREWSLRSVAKRVGMTASALCNVEKGRRGLSDTKLKDLAAIYGVAATKLLESVEMPS